MSDDDQSDYTIEVLNHGSSNEASTFELRSHSANVSLKLKPGIIRTNSIFAAKGLLQDMYSVTISDAPKPLVNDIIANINTRNENVETMGLQDQSPPVFYEHHGDGKLTLACTHLPLIARVIVTSRHEEGRAIDSTGDYRLLATALNTDLLRIDARPSVSDAINSTRSWH